MGLGVLFHRVDERCIPAPTVGSGYADTVLEQVKSCLATHAATFCHIVGASVRGTGARVHDHDFKRRQGMANTLELGLDILRRRDVTVRKMSEIEFDTGLKAPVERNLVDGDGA